MTLAVDNRAQVPGAGVHAFIVGVSDYLNLPDEDRPPHAGWHMNKLTGAALSAYEIFEWIQQGNLRLPIKTIRLLLSPSAAERHQKPALGAGGIARANRQAFDADALAWRNDAAMNPADISLFFFSGHGIQRGPEEGVLLLDDFLEPGAPLARCVEIGDIRNGMAPSPTFPNISLTQFYFVDACLARPATLQKFINPLVPNVFGAELNSVDRREAPLLFSTLDGAFSLGRPGKPSHFAEALILAFERAAEEPEDVQGLGTVWPITSLTMKNALDIYYKRHNLGTKVKLGGLVGSPVIRYLPHPPDVEIGVQIQPNSLGDPCAIVVRDENNQAAQLRDPKNRTALLPNPSNRTQFDFVVQAGIYRVEVDAAQLQTNPYRSQFKMITQKASSPWTHNVQVR